MAQSIQLSQYLGKPMECSCGHEHKTLLKRIDIDKGALNRLPGHITELGYHHIFMVCDVNTWKAAGETVAKLLSENNIAHKCLVIQDSELVPDEHAVGTVVTAFPKEADLILAVGSGTLNDLCKFVSYQIGLDYIVCATAPSMDGFASIGAALITNHVKTTYDAHVPVAIIGDTEVLAQAPMEMIVAGLGDILGKYTCLMDWRMAHLIEGEYYCEKIAGMVKQAVTIVVEQSSKIKDRDLEAVKAITEALALTGVAMSFVGNSRPASGSEHHLSHYWEMQFQMEGKKPILHGIKVGVGLLTVLNMYGKLAQEKVDFSALKEMKFDKAAWEANVRDCYKDAADGILEKYPKAAALRRMRTGRELPLSFITRAINILPSDILSLYMGATEINYPRYLAGSLLGMALSLVTFPIMGMNITEPASPWFWASIVIQILVSAFFIGGYWLCYRKKRREEEH